MIIKEGKIVQPMAAILVDYENVVGKNGLDGLGFLSAKDTLYIFYSNSCGKIHLDQMQIIANSGCRFITIKLQNTRANALDFYIATECGVLCQSGEKNLVVVTGDKGLRSIEDYVGMRVGMENVKLLIAPSIAQGLEALNTKGDYQQSKLKVENMQKVDLESEYAIREENNESHTAIMNNFKGTKVGEYTGEIINFLETNQQKTRRELYTSILHKFGRTNGIEIYRILKCAYLETT